MPLQLDTTVNYANGKAGLTTTAAGPAATPRRTTPTCTRVCRRARSATRARRPAGGAAPTPGDWLFFVVVDPDTGDTRFAATAAEHQQNVALFQQWLREHPNG